MDLSFMKLTSSNEKELHSVYKIIKSSGEYMYEEQGLSHWKSSYTLEKIKEHTMGREVFLVQDLETNIPVNTFQLEFRTENNLYKKNSIVYLNKFATLPEYEGKGIGKKSMAFIEDYCKEKKADKIVLDVYKESDNAINFYLKRNFIIRKTKATRRFHVYIMEKEL